MDVSFDTLVNEQARQVFDDFQAVLLAKYKTREGAIAGVAAEIHRVCHRYLGQQVSDELRQSMQLDIVQALLRMVAN